MRRFNESNRLHHVCDPLEPGLVVVIVFACLALTTSVGCQTSGSSKEPGVSTTASRSAGGVSSLKVVAAATPPLRVRRYVTSGTYPNVRGSFDLSAVNATLRQTIRDDQNEYLPTARKSVAIKNRYHGIYETFIDRNLLSASTVVVSALMPATKLYPGGNDGQTWVAATVQVPSGKAIPLNELFVDLSRALPVLARDWKAQIRGTRFWPCVAKDPGAYRPSPRNFRHFALTPHGLVFGFWQEPACPRLQAAVPYRAVRPYLSRLGIQLVKGVRRPS